PPWSGWWQGEGRPRVTIDEVRKAVSGHPDLPSIGDEDLGGPNSAVLALIWQEDGEARVLLTRRTAWLRSHSGQVAFPGGRVEPGESLVDAALREAQEEVGLDPATVRILGQLSRMHTISSGAGIFPFVGEVEGRPTLEANPDEVDRVFDVPLGELMADGVFHEEIWGLASEAGIGTERPIYFFDLAGETVWGATARMLFELLVLVIGRTVSLGE
ncbi:MAG: CoA pyrophosphatase, partial [Actinomycetota bacterium]|nr:CoA pyrophosphatase [Actinomycetota bacterium]